MTRNSFCNTSLPQDERSLRAKFRRLRIRQRAWRLKQVRGREEPSLCPEEATCVNCGQHFVGNYCARCGQYRDVPRFTIRGIMGNVLKTIFRVDGKFGRTILELLYRPGHLMRDFVRGHRVHYTPPLALLFLTIMFFVLLSTLVMPLLSNELEAVSMPLDINVETDDANVLAELLEQARSGTDQLFGSIPFLANAWDKFGEWASNSRAFQTLLMLPLLALCTSWGLRTLRAKYDYNLMEHIFIQAFVASQQCIVSILLVPLGLLFNWDNPLEMPFWLSLVLYWWVYRQLFLCSWWRALWVTLLMLLYMVLSITALVLPLLLYYYIFMA